MKKTFLLVAISAMVAAVPAHAISHSFRAKLERSGCTQVTEANGTCDPNKTKAQNKVHSSPKLSTKYTSSDADVVMNAPIDNAADYLLSKGWKPNNGDWFKGGRVLRLVVENGIVVNAQMM